MIFIEEVLDSYELVLTVEVLVDEPKVVRKRDIYGRKKRKTKKNRKQNWLCFLLD